MTSVATRQTFELSEQDVRLAVAAYIEKKFGQMGALTITVAAVPVTAGYGMQEHTSYVVKISATREVL